MNQSQVMYTKQGVCMTSLDEWEEFYDRVDDIKNDITYLSTLEANVSSTDQGENDLFVVKHPRQEMNSDSDSDSILWLVLKNMTSFVNAEKDAQKAYIGEQQNAEDDKSSY